MKARILSLLLIVALLVSVSVFAVEAAVDLETVNDPIDFATSTTQVCPVCGSEKTWKPLPVASAENTELELGGHYYLSADTTYDAAANTGNYKNATTETFKKICLHLNDQEWTGASFFAVLSHGTTLNIMGSGTIAGAGTDMATTYKLNGTCTLNLYGGEHTSAAANHTLPVASLSAANAKLFVMGDAAVYDNVTSAVAYSSSRKGGVISMTNGYLTISGGSVTTNGVSGKQGPYGGAIYITKGTAEMTGGIVSGGGANNGATIAMLGGSFTMSGTATINGGISSRGGGAVHLEGSSATFTMDGGTIQGGTTNNTSAGVSYTNTAGKSVNDNTYIGRGGGAVSVWDGATFTMNSGTIQGTKAGYAGGSVMVSGTDATFNLNAGTVKGSTSNTTRGGAVAVVKGGTLNIGKADGSSEVDTAILLHAENSGTSTNGNMIFNMGGIVNLYKGALVSGGQATGTANDTGGGSIYHVNTTVGQNDAAVDYVAAITMYDGKIEGGTSAHGAININAAFEMKGGLITGGTATKLGGNVFVRGNTFTMTGGTISGGTAVNGGNVYVHSGTFNMESGTITGGKVTGTAAEGENAAVNGYGGNVYNAATFNMGLAKADADLVENYVAPIISGGAAADGAPGVDGANVYTSKTFTMECGEIKDSVGANGAGVELVGGTFTMEAGEIKNNTVTGCGGNVNVYAGEFILKNGTISNTNEANTANKGGNIYLVENGTFTMEGGLISGGKSENDGGSVWNDGIFTMSGGELTGGKTSSGGRGAGIANESNKTNAVTISGTAWIHDNVCANNGGNIHSSSGTITVSGGVIENGTASPYGGNFCLNGGTAKLVFTNGTIQNGTAGAGGNIFALAGAEVTMSQAEGAETKILGGSNTGYQGGSIAIRKGTFNLQGGTIDATGGTCATNGGVVAVGWTDTSVATFNMTGGTIKNGAAATGGNVYVYGAGIFDLSGGFIENGTATTNGGSVYMAAGTFEMSGGTIGGATVDGETVTSLGGVAATNGGNVYMADGTFIMTGGTISYGSTTKVEEAASISTMTGGGNVHIAGGEFTLNGDEAKILNGTTNVSGGNIYVANGTFTLTEGEVADGTATYALGNGLQGGGNIYGNSANAIVNINGGKVYNGYAKRGGNTAVVSGAKLTVADGATITAGDEIMSGATGVNIFSRLATVTINGGTIDGGKNTAVNTAGRNVYAHSGTFNFNGGKLINGMRNGTGVYLAVANTTTVNLSGDAEVGQLVIENNKQPAISIASGYTGSVYFRFFTTTIHESMAYGVALPEYIVVAEGYANTASLFTGTKAAVYIPVAYGDISGDSVAELYATKLIKNVEGTMCDSSGTAGTNMIPKTVGIHDISEVGANESLSFAADDVTIDVAESMLIDTNGKDITVNASNDAVISLIDTTNDDFNGTGSLTLNGEGSVAAKTVAGDKTYIALKNSLSGNSYSAHRIEVKLTSVSLRPSSDDTGVNPGVYYKTKVQCDTTLAAAVDGYGVAASLTQMPNENFLTDATQKVGYTRFDGADFTGNGEVCGTMINDILVYGNTDASASRAAMPIYATAYVEIPGAGNGEEDLVIMADGVEHSLQTILEMVDAKVGADVPEKLLALYEAYADLMSGFMPNTKAAFEAANA